MAVKIRCIKKSNGYHENPHEAIEYYGWIEDGTGKNAVTPRQQMVNWVKDGVEAYVTDSNDRKVYCYVRKSVSGIEFLQTQSDGRQTNNLLDLYECS